MQLEEDIQHRKKLTKSLHSGISNDALSRVTSSPSKCKDLVDTFIFYDQDANTVDNVMIRK